MKYLRPILFLALLSLNVAAQEVVEPRELSTVGPNYPVEALKALPASGAVHTFLEIDATGRVTDVTAFGPVRDCREPNNVFYDQLRNAVVEAARQSTFTPAVKDGVAVSGQLVKIYKIAPAALIDSMPAKPEKILGGIIGGRAVSLPKPPYPQKAKPFRLQGPVAIFLVLDEQGIPLTAEPRSGHPLFFEGSAIAACGSKFAPTLIREVPVKVSGNIVYNFVL